MQVKIIYNIILFFEILQMTLDTIPSTATSGVGLPEILRPLASYIHFLKENECMRQKKDELKSPLPIGSPGEPLFLRCNIS